MFALATILLGELRPVVQSDAIRGTLKPYHTYIHFISCFYFISIFPLALFRLDTSFSYSYHFGNVPSLENCYLTPESASRKSSSNSISAYSEPGIAFVHSEPATPAFVPQAQKQYLYPSVYNDYNHLHRRKSDERYNRLRRKSNKYNREYNQYLLGRQ